VIPSITKKMKPTDAFNTMKFNIDNLVDRIWQQIPKIIGGLLVVTMVWHGIAIGGNLALAAPPIATSTDRVSAQVASKADQIKQAAKDEIDYAKTPIQDRPGEVKGKVNDGMNYTPAPADGNRVRTEDNADNFADKVKSFFGK
jgi:hypothetical protein